MVVKLNSYTLSDNSIDTMTSMLGRSRHINKEIGTTMCLRRDDIIMLRGCHVGEKISAPIMRKCNEEEEYIGHYHTHPIATSKATGIDLAKCGNSKIICVGVCQNKPFNKGRQQIMQIVIYGKIR